MPRLARVDVGNEIYHVINRANGRMQIFNKPEDYRVFENLIEEAKELTNMRILAYVIMPNHWHLVLFPKNDGDLGIFMHHLTNKHTRQVHVATKTIGSGHLYQGRYKSFLVAKDNYLLALIKYVERNAVRAKIVPRCEDWQWGSAWRRTNGTVRQKKLLDQIPAEIPNGYLKWINTTESLDDLGFVRYSVNKGVPYGREKWVDKMVTTFHLETTMRGVGRPKKIRTHNPQNNRDCPHYSIIATEKDWLDTPQDGAIYFCALAGEWVKYLVKIIGLGMFKKLYMECNREETMETMREKYQRYTEKNVEELEKDFLLTI